MKRQRDSWIDIGGTRSGSWIFAMGTDAGQILCDALPPPLNEDLLLLGVAHRECLQQARDQVRAQAIEFPGALRHVFVEEMGDEDRVDFQRPANPDECPFCQNTHGPWSKEDIYPKWLLRELKVKGAQSVEGDRRTTRIVGPLTQVCADCNNTWMSTLENDVKDVLLALIWQTRTITSDEQEMLASWAALKALLFDLVSGDPVIPRGFGHDLRIHKRPHRGMRVWIAAYSEPTDALATRFWRIMAKDRDEVLALCVTFTIVRVAFQVLVPFEDGTLSDLMDFAGSVQLIWPSQESVDWPPRYHFDKDSLGALAQRIFDNREPVVVEVTLKEAIRSRPSAQVDAS